MKVKAKKERSKIWTYIVSYDNEIEIQLCKTLFMKIFHVSRSASTLRLFVYAVFIILSKRLRILQEKIVKNETFVERRSKYERKNKIITEELRAFMNAHLLLIPRTKSHYTQSLFA